MVKGTTPGGTVAPRHTTIYDVAEAAQVSPATVSHVLNGTAPISPDTQARIRKVVRELDYRPNANARSLRTAHSRIIGVILQDISSEYYARSVAGILQSAQNENYVVLTIDARFRTEVLEKSVAALVERRVDGLIFVGGARDEKSVEMACAAEVPLVFGDRHMEGFPCVEFDNFNTVRGIVNAACDTGYKRFTYVGEPVDRQQNLERRYGGFIQALDDRGVPEGDRLSVLDPSMNFEKMAPAYELFGSLLDSGRISRESRIVITSNDMVAQGVISAALRRGLRVPEDVAVFGFDDISIAAYSTPSISTVAQDPHQLGMQCFQKMMAQLQKRGDARDNLMLPQKVAIRTTAPIPEVFLLRHGITLAV
jgi:LacI family transcriptional regulator